MACIQDAHVQPKGYWDNDDYEMEVIIHKVRQTTHDFQADFHRLRGKSFLAVVFLKTMLL